MDKITKALLLGLAIAVAYTAATRMSAQTEPDTAASEVFLFPQFSLSAAADRSPDVKSSGSEEVVYAFKLSEILDSLSEAHHSI